MNKLAEQLQAACGKKNANLDISKKDATVNADNDTPTRDQRNPKASHRQEVIQKANSAEESTEQANSATQQPAPPKPSRYIYNAEVNKSANIKCKTAANRDVPYIAVKKQSSICDKCYPDAGQANPCASKCFSFQCKRCNFYGHSISQCKQSHSSNGQPITSN